MEGGSRRRTRSQWDEYYLNIHLEKKKKRKETKTGGAAANVLRSEPIVVDADDGVQVSRVKGSGGEISRNGVDDDDDVRAEILSSDGGVKKLEEEEIGDEDDGAQILRNSAADFAVEISSEDEDEDGDEDEDEDGDDDMVLLREEIASKGPNSRNEAESSSKKADFGADCREKVEIEPQVQRDLTVDFDKSKDNSDETTSDSDSDSDSDSEPESTTEDDDETWDEEKEREEEASSDSENEAADDVENGEPEDFTERADDKTKLETHVEDSRTESDDNAEEEDDDESDEGCEETIRAEAKMEAATHGKSESENLRKENGSKHVKDDESEGISSERQSETEIFMEKNCRVRKKSARKHEESQSKESDLKKSSLIDEGDCFVTPDTTRGEKYSVKNLFLGSKKANPPKEIDLIKILVDSINSFKGKQCSIDENALTEDELPLRFRFEDEVVELPLEKSEWERHVDSLFCDLELGLRETENDCTDIPETENDERVEEVDDCPAAACLRGEHSPILDEEIGVVCQYCYCVIMEIKHVLPPFHVPKWGRRNKEYSYDELKPSAFSEIQFEGSSPTTPDSTACTKGTVWDLLPGVKKDLYPHQREAFEFMWRNIGGHTKIKKLKRTLEDDARGCIISHAPGTGKTRLTIVFLQSFLKLYPSCCPMIIAPKGMLLTWEAEFKKWNFNAPFHNLNKKEMSGNENVAASELLGQFGNGNLSAGCIRLLKLYSWSRGGSILGISYTLFEKLAGEHGRGFEHEKIREVLLERPGLLVLDEGHTPRNDRSMIWKALTKVSTQRRIILSGTPFQNNLRELYNTLCVVNPKYDEARERWKKPAKSDGINMGSAMKLRAMIDPFTHVHRGTILEESLPGLSHTLVFLHPTETQKKLLENACEESEIFRRIRMVSLISVHPSINAVKERYSLGEEEARFDLNEGVKARFLLKLIHFSDALKERVLVFSQFLDSLDFIKEQLESVYSWNEGREVLYMNGKVDEKKRQESITCFNDETSEAKVMLATEKACSEGINLIGASRVVLLDTVWNPSVEKQAISRAYRIGQKRIVYVYRLFTSGVEVRQYAKQNQKEKISQWIFALGERQSEKVRADMEDKVLDGMRNLENFKNIFENVIIQPTESDLIRTFGLGKKN